MIPIRKTYVEFQYPGLLFSNISTQEVETRDTSKLDMPKNAFAFNFFDIISMTIEVDGELVELESKRIHKSNLHYYGGKVYTAQEIRRKFPQEKTLISNMRINGYKKVIKCRTGNWQPLEKDDVFIKEA